MPAFLATYRPIISTAHGRAAAQTFDLAPFVDSSCRREPDLESSPYPAISALCRGKLFAPRLGVGDNVVYLTKKGRYGTVPSRHWRLVAVLRVLRRFETHHAAASWYRAQGLTPPSNCIVDGNPPVPLERTGGPRPRNRFGDPADPVGVVNRWNAAYRKRARRCGVMGRDQAHPPRSPHAGRDLGTRTSGSSGAGCRARRTRRESRSPDTPARNAPSEAAAATLALRRCEPKPVRFSNDRRSSVSPSAAGPGRDPPPSLPDRTPRPWGRSGGLESFLIY